LGCSGCDTSPKINKNFMDKEIFIIFTALINLILGFIIYTKNKNIVNKSFLIFTITTSIWSIGLFFYTHPILFSALEWIKITYFLSTFTVPALFSFCFIFSKGKSQGLLRPLLFYWIITFPFILILFLTNWWVVNVVPQEFGFHTITGSAYIFYSLFAGIYILLAVKLLFKK